MEIFDSPVASAHWLACTFKMLRDLQVEGECKAFEVGRGGAGGGNYYYVVQADPAGL